MTGPSPWMRSSWATLKLQTPAQRTLPWAFRRCSASQPSSMSSAGLGQWIWYRSMQSSFRRRRLASHSRSTESRFRRFSIRPAASQAMAHLVKT